MSSLRIVVVSTEEVDAHTEQYNSNFHTSQQAPLHDVPTEGSQRFSRWLPLIARSQGIPSSAVQRIVLTRAQAQLLHTASDSTIHTQKLNRVYAEDLDDEIVPVFSRLEFGEKGFFLRLDACSPKDGVGGNMPLRSVNELILRITSSLRARNAIEGALTSGKAMGEGVNLYFLPFDERMATENEYRVFCAPENGRITALSQYKWHAASVLQERWNRDGEEVVKTIWEGVKVVHMEIMAELDEENKMDNLMLKQGFSFDVMWIEKEKKCALIELNSFGTRSGCGSCLFHWLRDMNVLYGKDEFVEFRISLEGQG